MTSSNGGNPTSNMYDVFMAKYSMSATFVYAKQLGNADNETFVDADVSPVGSAKVHSAEVFVNLYMTVAAPALETLE